MPHDPRKYVYDIWQAAHHILDFTAGKSFEDYQADLLLRSGVERQFEIIGEALNQLARVAPEIAARVPEHRRIISFRNLLEALIYSSFPPPIGVGGRLQRESIRPQLIETAGKPGCPLSRA